MHKFHQSSVLQIEGWFIGWADERVPHRRCKLFTPSGKKVVKIAKSLRDGIQTWQPGIWLSLQGKQRKLEIKIDRVIAPTSIDKQELLPIQIQICNGKACQRRGSGEICNTIERQIAACGMTDAIEIHTVRCLDRCKAAPHVTIELPKNRSTRKQNLHYQKVTPTAAGEIVTACLRSQESANNRYNAIEIDNCHSIIDRTDERLQTVDMVTAI
jgi:(2Fe-2S) ferredoxin